MGKYRLDIQETDGATFAINAAAALTSLSDMLISFDPNFTRVLLITTGSIYSLVMKYKDYPFNLKFYLSSSGGTMQYGIYTLNTTDTNQNEATTYYTFSGTAATKAAATNVTACHIILNIYTNTTDILFELRPYDTTPEDWSVDYPIGYVCVHDMLTDTDLMYGFKFVLLSNTTGINCMSPFTGKNAMFNVYAIGTIPHNVETTMADHMLIHTIMGRQSSTSYEHPYRYIKNYFEVIGYTLPTGRTFNIGTDTFIVSKNCNYQAFLIT